MIEMSCGRRSALSEMIAQILRTIVMSICKFIAQVHRIAVVLCQQPRIDEFSIRHGDLPGDHELFVKPNSVWPAHESCLDGALVLGSPPTEMGGTYDSHLFLAIQSM